MLSVNGDEEFDAGEAAWHKCREQLVAAGLEFQLMKDALHEEDGMLSTARRRRRGCATRFS